MVDRPKVGVGVFVVRDGKILVGHRIGSHGSDTWSLPGGHLEFGESVEACAKREVLEEAGIDIGDIQPITFTNDIFPEEDRHYITLFMRANYLSGDVERKEPEKCLEWRWVEWPHIPEPLFWPLQNFMNQGTDPFRV